MKAKEQQRYERIIRPVVPYASEIWVMTKQQENELETWRKKILGNICSTIKRPDKDWQTKTNQEILVM